jgi:hypothetical protein
VKFGSASPHRQDFARLVQITEQARQNTDDAFAALQRHAGTHRCVAVGRAAAGGS